MGGINPGMGGRMGRPPIGMFGGMNQYGDEYDDEYSQEDDEVMDDGAKKYQIINGKRYQRIEDEAAATNIENMYQQFLMTV